MYLHFLAVIFVLHASFALGIRIGITRDYYAAKTPPDKGSISFSADIAFDDASIPGDRTKMSDAQLINLAKVAFSEMAQIWTDSLLPISSRPGTMLAMVSGGHVFFASSIKEARKDTILRSYNNVPGSPGDYIARLEGSHTIHRAYGCCAEPNGLLFYSEQNRADTDPFKTPPKTDSEPRIAVWLGTGSQPKAINPCNTQDGKGYGCEELVGKYGFKPVDTVAPDDRGQDDWKFTIQLNRRKPAQCPNQPPPRPPPNT